MSSRWRGAARGALRHRDAGRARPDDFFFFFGLLAPPPFSSSVASRSFASSPARRLSQRRLLHLAFSPSSPSSPRQQSTSVPPRGQATAATAKRKAKRGDQREQRRQMGGKGTIFFGFDVGARQRCSARRSSDRNFVFPFSSFLPARPSTRRTRRACGPRHRALPGWPCASRRAARQWTSRGTRAFWKERRQRRRRQRRSLSTTEQMLPPLPLLPLLRDPSLFRRDEESKKLLTAAQEGAVRRRAGGVERHGVQRKAFLSFSLVFAELKEWSC